MRDLSFYVECRQSAIKVQRQQSDGSERKNSNPHTNLSKHHTCRANFLLARHNTRPLVALNYLCWRFDKNQSFWSKWQEKETGWWKKLNSAQSKHHKNFEFLIFARILKEIYRFVLGCSFRIEWCKNFEESVTYLKIQ